MQNAAMILALGIFDNVLGGWFFLPLQLRPQLPLTPKHLVIYLLRRPQQFMPLVQSADGHFHQEWNFFFLGRAPDSGIVQAEIEREARAPVLAAIHPLGDAFQFGGSQSPKPHPNCDLKSSAPIRRPTRFLK